jgi:hypothetical protein
MYAPVDESQSIMIAQLDPRKFGKKPLESRYMAKKMLFIAAGALWAVFSCAPVALAQDAPTQAKPAKPAKPPVPPDPPAPNPFRAVTDFFKVTTETNESADFVRETRPDTMDYSHLTGVDKPRAPLKTPEELEADKAALIATREQAGVRRKKLQDEKLQAIAPNKAPPATDERF